MAWNARLLEKPARLLTRILDRFRQMDIFRRLDKTNLPPALKDEIKADAAWKEDARNDFAGALAECATVELNRRNVGAQNVHWINLGMSGGELALAHFALCDRIDKLVLAANAKPPEENKPLVPRTCGRLPWHSKKNGFFFMPDYSLAPCVTLVFGRSGSGKTTFAFRCLANVSTEQPANTNPAACVFIFDWRLEASQRLGLPPCGTAAQCEAAVASRWVVFNPAIMFQERQRDAFRWFCHWVFEVSQRGPGKKVLFVDELWKFVDTNSHPAELEKVARMGQAENLELLTSTQHPRDYHRDIRAEVTEWVCFSMDEPGELDAVRPYFRGVDRVAQLPRGSFIAYNRESGEDLLGRFF